MADNEALRFELKKRMITRLQELVLHPFVNFKKKRMLCTYIKLDKYFYAIGELERMINNNNWTNEKEALMTLVYVRSKGHIYIDLRDDTRASTPPDQRRWGMFYCIMQNRQHIREVQFVPPYYGRRTSRFETLKLQVAPYYLEVAGRTLLSPGAFPYNDGIELFQYDPLNIEEGLDVGTLL